MLNNFYWTSERFVPRGFENFESKPKVSVCTTFLMHKVAVIVGHPVYSNGDILPPIILYHPKVSGDVLSLLPPHDPTYSGRGRRQNMYGSWGGSNGRTSPEVSGKNALGEHFCWLA